MNLYPFERHFMYEKRHHYGSHIPGTGVPLDSGGQIFEKRADHLGEGNNFLLLSDIKVSGKKSQK